MTKQNADLMALTKLVDTYVEAERWAQDPDGMGIDPDDLEDTVWAVARFLRRHPEVTLEMTALTAEQRTQLEEEVEIADSKRNDFHDAEEEEHPPFGMLDHDF